MNAETPEKRKLPPVALITELVVDHERLATFTDESLAAALRDAETWYVVVLSLLAVDIKSFHDVAGGRLIAALLGSEVSALEQQRTQLLRVQHAARAELERRVGRAP